MIIALIDPNLKANETLLYTASRDRLIKVWHCDYSTRQYNLVANLDEHADWVN